MSESASCLLFQKLHLRLGPVPLWSQSDCLTGKLWSLPGKAHEEGDDFHGSKIIF